MSVGQSDSADNEGFISSALDTVSSSESAAAMSSCNTCEGFDPVIKSVVIVPLKTPVLSSAAGSTVSILSTMTSSTLPTVSFFAITVSMPFTTSISTVTSQ